MIGNRHILGLAKKKHPAAGQSKWKEREPKIGQLLSEGASITDLAEHFGVSRTRIQQVLRQLQVQTQVQAAIQRAKEEGYGDR